MKGYLFNTEEDAIDARSRAAAYMGFPKTPDCVTLYWVGYEYSDLDDFYYIVYDDGLEIVLGEPVDFEVTYLPE